MIYLRQPGQSSRGPAFRVHTKILQERGFQSLLDQAVLSPALRSNVECLHNSCTGCDKHARTIELYIPAPFTTNIDNIFDHHVTTRNFFAWLYNIPLAGRALGKSFVALKGRIDQYRDVHDKTVNKKEIITYAESQRYLDFRECVDHALAALHLAENLHLEDMWIDTFAHVVGMSHRDLHSSLEYAALSSTTQSLILESRLEMDVRLARASVSIETFFGDDLSGNFLGLSQAARDHFDRFRSFLHGFYIDKYGFWPPSGFENDSSKYQIYATLYSDFRNLYHHIVDPESTFDWGTLATSGGVCTLQNISAFDARHGFETLPRPLPQLPLEPAEVLSNSSTLSRRRSWNPVAQRKAEKEQRHSQRKQALINASNRDVMLMECRLVRKYSEFECNSVGDGFDELPWTDARKVRWILIYAILQTLISIMAAPKHVRNTEGLSYSLCCHVPSRLPWAHAAAPVKSEAATSKVEIAPDVLYTHSNASAPNSERLLRSTSRGVTDRKDRRLTMPARSSSKSSRSPSVPRVASLKRLLSRKKARTDSPEATPPVPNLPSKPHCEILVHGYGNGLNEVRVEGQRSMTLPSPEQMLRRKSLVPNVVPNGDIFRHTDQRMPHDGDSDIPTLSPTSSASVSRETSNASSASTKTKSTVETDELQTPVDNKPTTDELAQLLKLVPLGRKSVDLVYEEGLPGSIHINTKTWDDILGF